MACCGLSWTEILILAVGVLTALYYYLSRNFNYFEKMGLKCARPFPLVGSVWEFFRKDMIEVHLDWYKKYGPIFGIFEGGNPILVVSDTMMLRSILQKDFSYFVDRRTFDSLDDIFPTFRKTLTNLKGEEWRQLRSVVSPTFTTGKIKNMMLAMDQNCETFLENMKDCARNGKAIDTKQEFDGYTLSVIASCGFGIELDSLKNPNNPFLANARALSKTFRNKYTLIILMCFGKLVRYLPFNIIDKKIMDYFDNTLDNIIKTRNEDKEAHKNRIDFLQLLLNARKSDTDEVYEDSEISDSTYFQEKKYSAKKVLDDLTIKGQAFQLFFAGFETTSNALTLAAYCLATNPETQDRLCEELDQKLGKGKIGYESLSESNLPYLDAVVSETMRIFPPAPMLERKCTQDYQYENIRIQKGMLVQIPTYAMHLDENNFPEPKKFQPERFLPENKGSIQPLTYLPFGAGPRNCVGMRFALLEFKMVLATLLREIKFLPNPDTEIPLKYNLTRLFTSPISLSVELRHKE